MEIEQLDYVDEYIKNQPLNVQQKILSKMERLLTIGLQPLLHTKDASTMPGYKNLYELRVKFNKTLHRLFFIIKQNNYLFVHAFSKKSQKTPLREIKTAINRIRLIGGI